MNEIYDEDGDDREIQEGVAESFSNVSTIESLLMQAFTNQLQLIVDNQQRNRRLSYDNQYKQVLTLESLANTIVSLTDSDTIFLSAVKYQGFINKAALEYQASLQCKEPEFKENNNDASASDPTPETISAESTTQTPKGD